MRFVSAYCYSAYRDPNHDLPAITVLVVVGAVVAWLISEGCKEMMRPGDYDARSKDSHNDQRHLHRALSANFIGVGLIALEPLLMPYMKPGFGFHFEELLLASSGLNILVEEAKLVRQYRDMRSRRDEAKEEADKLLKQIKDFRAGVVNTFNSSFGLSSSRKGSSGLSGG